MSDPSAHDAGPPREGPRCAASSTPPGALRPDLVSPDIVRLVTEHHGAAFRYAFRLTGSTADAEDLVQQAFLIAQQKSDQIRDPARPRGWLLAVVRNAYLKNRRRRQPIPAANLEMDLDAFPGVPDVPQDIDEEALQSAIDKLSDEFKVVLMMFYFEERSYAEIAEELNVPAGTVMSRLSRAKSFLRRRLSPSELGGGETPIETATASAKNSKPTPRPHERNVVSG